MLLEEDFSYLRRLLKERSGLALTTDKAYLITTRLKPILEQFGLKDIGTLVARMKTPGSREIVEQVVEAMTTNESLFFRDTKPFEALTAMMLPKLIAARGGRPIRIWCAAASTGQEPYSIAILLEENGGRLRNHPIEILASDLSQAALTRARMGEYTAFEVGRGVPQHYLDRYFQKTARNHFVILPKIRSRINFQCRNLLEPFDRVGPVDIVFCRNVLIYFDRVTKADVLNRIASIVPSDGYLVLGGAETTLGLTDAFVRHTEWRNVYLRAPVTGKPAALATDKICA
ncbi:protein-glutamate O-methyltransferase CheR [Acuticoccus sp. M5D2P5]|uniref:CheR family methyltransferase n=1 Tax=Acuticoccus kalidii TaxID=2910977 RepID=UPI001F383F98|nr:protein-glutamate O-methyltransferase CheR [Acuticoccus kalidii]MCF3932500.1 protein-glutamate O-methyltransferase CheR [Acuticoccus kalidii]